MNGVVNNIGVLSFFESTNTLPWENKNYGNPSFGIKSFGKNVLPSFNFLTTTPVGTLTEFTAKKVRWNGSEWEATGEEQTLTTTKIVVVVGTTNDKVYHISDYALATDLTGGYWQLEIKTATRTWVSDIFFSLLEDDTPISGSSFTVSFDSSFY